MSWTTEEIENLISMLFSADSRNQLLAMELMQTKDNADDFGTALVLLEYVELENEEIKETAKHIIDKLCTPRLIKDWKDSIRLIEDLWRYKKEDFLVDLAAFEAVAPIVDAYMKLAPRYSDFYTDIGKQLIYFKLYKKALFYLEKGTEMAPNSYNAHFDYAYNLREGKKNADTIIKHYEKCLEIDSNNYIAYHNLGRIYANQKEDYEKAVAIFKRGLLIYPNSTDTMIELALAEEELGNVETAKNILESVVQKDHSSDLGHNNLAYMLWTHFKEYEKAKEHIKTALKLAPKIALYWHTLAEVEWYGFRDKDKAIAALQQALKIQKTYKGAKAMLKEIEND